METRIITHDGQFHVTNGLVSHVIRILPGGEPNTIYFGPAIHDRDDFSDLQELAVRDTLQTDAGHPGLSLEQIRREYPQGGSSDLRPCALDVGDAAGSHAVKLAYDAYRIVSGKVPLDGLPSTFANGTGDDADCATLEIDLADASFGLRVTLSETMFDGLPVVARSVRVTNVSHLPQTVESAYSASLDLPDADWDMLTLTGAWAREAHVERTPLRTGLQGVSSIRGHSSQHANPYLALARPNADEMQGEAMAATLVYSGNFDASVFVDSYARTRLRIGINPEPFSWRLAPGETFQTPEAILAYSGAGFNGLSQALHALYRRNLIRRPWNACRSPIVVNTWEAVHMAMDETSLTAMARSAKELGMEMLVVDDGWFGHRDRADSSLGDWFADRRKFPNGLKPLADAVHRMGMGFGLWFEPEMISEDSDLYRTHPDWVLGDPRLPLHALGVQRCQYVLDMTRPDVVAYLRRTIGDVIGKAGVDYIKWDMNRSLSEAYSRALPPDRQGEVFHRYALGYYRLLHGLAARFPDLLIESCASGGARVDAGTLAYAPQAWISDDTDALERVKIQYGTSMMYPVGACSNHVSAVPNEETGRRLPLKMRGDVALFGTFGYELDPALLDDGECARISRQIDWSKRLGPLMRSGTFWRLRSPFAPRPGFDAADAAWMVVSADRRNAVVGWYRALTGVNAPVPWLRLAGLDADMRYAVTEVDTAVADAGDTAMAGRGFTPWRPRYGDELMHAGLPLTDRTTVTWGRDPFPGDGSSRLFILTAVDASL
ncbi:alpha-galactosidase [Bifidobacterium sp. 82T24]|uniref:alpha-galactosidase n=1 Tax=Bifidobacterium pluvialisilvae TaxID=2834436 RepID=UPI001C58D084|nr:alpha-galactosidase [Bifidobacterium pluvialisilvae]MBW3087980.1 alpha-galactosidase [Bifidobacterium pluvialisilvae]